MFYCRKHRLCSNPEKIDSEKPLFQDEDHPGHDPHSVADFFLLCFRDVSGEDLE